MERLSHASQKPPRSHGAGEAALMEAAAVTAARQAHAAATLDERFALAELAQSLFDEATRCRLS